MYLLSVLKKNIIFKAAYDLGVEKLKKYEQLSVPLIGNIPLDFPVWFKNWSQRVQF